MGLLDFLGGGDYGASGYKNAYQSSLNQQQGIGGQFGNLAGTTGQDFTNYGNGQRQSIGDYAKLLQQTPYTDSYSTAALNQATSGLTNDYLGAKSALTADLARRGLAAPGGNSSMLTGGLASIDAARAGQLAGDQNQLALQRIAQQRQNAGDLVNLYSGAAGNAYGQTAGSLGAENGIYGQVGQGNMNLYQNAVNQQSQNANGLLGLIKTGASLVPYL